MNVPKRFYPKRQKFNPEPRECPGCAKMFEPKGPGRSRQKTCSKACAQRVVGRAGKGVTGQRGKHLFKTGRHLHKDGYVRVLTGGHPWPRKSRYMSEHVKVMEEQIQRRILPGEVVHHLNRVRADNRLVNLKLMTASAHAKLHANHARA